MGREAATLTGRAEELRGERGSRAWFLAESNRGEQLQDQVRTDEATRVFEQIMEALDDPSILEDLLPDKQ